MARSSGCETPESERPAPASLAPARALAEAPWRTLHRSDVERALHSLEVVLGTVESHSVRRARESLVDAYKQLDRLWAFAEKG